MRTTIKSSFAALAASLLALSAGVASAAHESNNRADLEGDAGLAHGKAIVNYVKGGETWTANVSVRFLPEGVYVFAVRANTAAGTGAPQEICMFTTDGRGGASCSEQQFDLGGFHEALILDMDGNIVLSGFFERRGGQRVGG